MTVEQDLPVATGGPHMHDLVGADLRQMAAAGAVEAAAQLAGRKALGIARYGQPLQAFNGRDAARDAREEILDLLVYLRQAIEEGRTDLNKEYRVALWLGCRLVATSAAAAPRELDEAETVLVGIESHRFVGDRARCEGTLGYARGEDRYGQICEQPRDAAIHV